MVYNFPIQLVKSLDRACQQARETAPWYRLV